MLWLILVKYRTLLGIALQMFADCTVCHTGSAAIAATTERQRAAAAGADVLSMASAWCLGAHAQLTVDEDLHALVFAAHRRVLAKAHYRRHQQNQQRQAPGQHSC
jgi:hypothetical protein